MVKVTEKEYKFLIQISKSDYSSDGHGFNDWITDFDYNMKSVRGLIPSLVEKGIIRYEEKSGINDEKGREMACAWFNDEYQDIENHKIKNILINKLNFNEVA